MRVSLQALLLVLVVGGGAVAAQEGRISEQEALQMLDDCKSKKAALEAEIASLEKELEGLRATADDVEKRYSALMKEIEELRAEINKYPSEYEVVKGDCLYKIAAKRYIYNNAAAWPRIYRANSELIKDPNLIYPGWVLHIPHGLVTSITVMPYDCLWKIAGFYWIYNDPTEWPRIYKANTDQIKDPDLIYPGQVLKIPRD